MAKHKEVIPRLQPVKYSGDPVKHWQSLFGEDEALFDPVFKIMGVGTVDIMWDALRLYKRDLIDNPDYLNYWENWYYLNYEKLEEAIQVTLASIQKSAIAQ